MSYLKAVKKYEDTTGEEFGPLPCSWCQKPTLRSLLSQHGARCLQCYEAYLQSPEPTPGWMADKRTEGTRAWADALKAHEEAGGNLSGAQKTMWRAVIREVEAA